MRGFFVALLAFAASWLAGLLPATAPAEQKFAAPPSLVLITLDTTRNDAIGPAPGRPSRTPVLDRLAADGVRFQEAIAPTPLTLPSHASLLTGLDPPEHGLRDNGSFALPRELPTLATVLSERGYETAAFVATRVLDRRFGLARGFDTYDDRMVAERTGEYGYPERDAAAVTSAALAWLTERSLERPYFVWVHYYDPHAPYAAPGSDPRRSAKERYRDEIAFVDRQIGRLLASAPGAPADRVVAVVGDHGEALGEHGERTHGIFVYRATMVVPLILSGAGVPTGREVGETVAARRLAPTLLRLLAAPGAGRRSAPGTAVPGTALPGTVLPGLDLGDPPPEAAYSESQMPARTYGWSGLTALSDGDHRLIRAPRPELYEIVSDPDEQNNLVREQRALAGQLRDRLLGLEAGFTTHQPLPLAA
ncbi:MAG: sulfatase, partial [Acidobacteriota bacterium]